MTCLCLSRQRPGTRGRPGMGLWTVTWLGSSRHGPLLQQGALLMLLRQNLLKKHVMNHLLLLLLSSHLLDLLRNLHLKPLEQAPNLCHNLDGHEVAIVPSLGRSSTTGSPWSRWSKHGTQTVR